MQKIVKKIIFLCLLPFFCSGMQFPDFEGILDFSKPDKISNRLFILTNPKSGSHLLLYSIMKITQRPLRGRVAFWHFENDPPFFPPENMMEYPLDFTKPTTYWGHEYHLLKPLNQNNNKLIFIIRNFKENIASNLILKNRSSILSRVKGPQSFNLGDLLFKEITQESMVFKEYMIRLQLFDEWENENKCLISFEDLALHPEVFVPQVMAFIEDHSNYTDFIDHYEDFQKELMLKYRKKGNKTDSATDLKYFSNRISSEILHKVDAYVKEHYPKMWEIYLHQFEENP